MWILFVSYPSVAYRLVYHEVWIRASTLIQAVKELLLINYFMLDTIYISPYPLLCLCGTVLLVPPPEEPSGYLHPLFLCTQLIYRTPCNVLRNFFLLPPHVLQHWPNPCCPQGRIHQWPIPFPAIAPPLRHPRNPYWNPVVENFQDCHHWVHDHPYFLPYRITTFTNALYILTRAFTSAPIFPITFATTPYFRCDFLKLLYNATQLLLSSMKDLLRLGKVFFSSRGPRLTLATTWFPPKHCCSISWKWQRSYTSRHDS